MARVVELVHLVDCRLRLDDAQMADLEAVAHNLDMAVLVEMHTTIN